MNVDEVGELTPEQTEAKADLERAATRYADAFGADGEIVVNTDVEALAPSGRAWLRRFRWRFSRNPAA